MKSLATFNWMLSITIFICTLEQTLSFMDFQCLKTRQDPMPDLPESYSTDIRLNFHYEKSTIEVKHAVKITSENEKTIHKELLEFKKGNRRVKYIIRGDQKAVLVITYKGDDHPKCVVKKKLNMKEFIENEDSGPGDIISKTAEAMIQHNNFYPAPYPPYMENGVPVQKWEGCFSDPRINVSVSFSDPSWTHSHVSSLKSSATYIELVEARIDNYYMTAVFSNFNPETPDDSLFQPPDDVFCASFRSDKSPPKIFDYFSYDAEILLYENALGVDPIVTRTKVYYDYPAGLSRIDFYEALSKDSEMFSPLIAQKKSIIRDFNAGIQYSFDPFTGQCTLDTFKSTFSVISSEETKDGKILTGKAFFLLDNAALSYNGQFSVRGIMADVFTTSKIDPQTKKKSVFSWYFSTEGTRVVETEYVAKNVLLRMTVRPETNLEKEGVTIVNFFNFANAEPNVLTYDITSCYNETLSKILVLTFPAHDSLRGAEKLIGMSTHLALKDATGVSKQRIFIKEIVFSGNYMYAEFDILEAPSLLEKPTDTKEVSLEDAIKKLRDAIEKDKFYFNVPVGNNSIQLIPEPDGLNVFAGDRRPAPSVVGYKEGSVISMAVGMLFLGLLLGMVTLNLIMSRKFGVSLFQKAKYRNQPFGNTESSM